MNAVLTIAQASVTEHVRRKLVIFFLILALLAGAGIVTMGLQRSAGVSLADLLVALIIRLLPVLTTLAAVAVSMNNIGRPFADGEAMLVLSRPVARWQYVLGRLLASAALVVGLCLVIVLLLQGVNTIVETELGAELWTYWAAQLFNLILLVAITTLMSALFANPVIAAITAFVAYAFSSIIGPLHHLASAGASGGATRTVIAVLYYVSPRTLADDGSTFLVWPLVYLAAAILVTMGIVQRKEL